MKNVRQHRTTAHPDLVGYRFVRANAPRSISIRWADYSMLRRKLPAGCAGG